VWSGATANDLHQAMTRIRLLAYVILDGTLIPIDRVHDHKPYYSGKHRRHGMNVQVIVDAAGRLVWASAAIPGSARDLTAVRTHGIIAALTNADVMTFAGQGISRRRRFRAYPFKRHRYRPKLSRRQKAVNKAHARIRCRGERAVATLKTWKIRPSCAAAPPGRPQWSRPSSFSTTSNTRPTKDETLSRAGRPW